MPNMGSHEIQGHANYRFAIIQTHLAANASAQRQMGTQPPDAKSIFQSGQLWHSLNLLSSW